MTDEPGWEPVSRPESAPPPPPSGPPLSSSWAAEQPPAQHGWGPPAGAGQPSGSGPQPPGWGPPPAGAAPPPPWSSPKPGVIPLRPLGVGEILDGAISTIRAKPRIMLGFSAVVAVATQLVTLPITWLLLHDTGDAAFSLDQPSSEQNDFAVTASALSAAGVQVVVTLIATLLLTGILTVVLSKAVLGQPVDTGDAWAQARPRLPALFAVTVLVPLMGLGAAVLLLAPGVLLAVTGAPAAAIVAAFLVGVPVLIGLGVYFYVGFALAPAAVVLEKQRVLASLRRSRRLVKGAWWRTFGIVLLVNVIAQTLSGILSGIFTVVSLAVAYLQGGADNFNPYALVPLMVSSIGTILASSIAWPFTAVSSALIYIDRRMRREALDLELTRAAGLAPPGQSATPGAPLTGPPPPPPPYGR